MRITTPIYLSEKFEIGKIFSHWLNLSLIQFLLFSFYFFYERAPTNHKQTTQHSLIISSALTNKSKGLAETDQSYYLKMYTHSTLILASRQNHRFFASLVLVLDFKL